MAVDFCLAFTTTFDDLSLSAVWCIDLQIAIRGIIRRGAKVIEIGGIWNMTFAQVPYDHQRIYLFPSDAIAERMARRQ